MEGEVCVQDYDNTNVSYRIMILDIRAVATGQVLVGIYLTTFFASYLNVQGLVHNTTKVHDTRLT